MRCIICALIIALLACCNTKDVQKNSILSNSNLKSSFIDIEAGKAISLKSPKGAFINIQANSFDVAAGTKVRIELKEAYSITDILLAGLATTSNGRPLQSGGMIYFNATANDKNVEVKNAVQISLPSSSYQEGMQLFKGGNDATAPVNWTDPTPLDSSGPAQQLALGKSIFMANCASCHKITRKFTGPELSNTMNRIPNRQWLYQFVKNPGGMIVNDKYAKKIYNEYAPTVMTGFPQLRRIEIDAIMAFVENEKLKNTGTNVEPSTSANTSEIYDTAKVPYEPISEDCGYDTFYSPKSKEFKELPYVDLSDAKDDYSFDSTLDLQANKASVIDNFLNTGFEFIYAPKGIYQFNITGNGWYNCDKYLNDERLTEIDLSADLKSTDLTMTVYYAVPALKILLNANIHKNNIYVFDDETKLKSLVGAEAFIFAIGNKDDKVYYGFKKFIVSKSQVISIEVKQSTKEAILNSIMSNRIDGLEIDVEQNEKKIMKKDCDAYSRTDN